MRAPLRVRNECTAQMLAFDTAFVCSSCREFRRPYLRSNVRMLERCAAVLHAYVSSAGGESPPDAPAAPSSLAAQWVPSLRRGVSLLRVSRAIADDTLRAHFAATQLEGLMHSHGAVARHEPERTLLGTLNHTAEAAPAVPPRRGNA